MSVLADTLKQILNAKLPKDAMFKELKDTSHGAAVTNKLVEMLDQAYSVSPKTASGLMLPGKVTGKSPLIEAEELMLTQSPDRVQTAQFLSRKSVEYIKKSFPDFNENISYAAEQPFGMHLDINSLKGDTGVLAHEGQHLMEYKGKIPRPHMRTQQPDTYFTDIDGVDASLGKASDWSKLYAPHYSGVYDKTRVEVNPMIMATINKMVAGHPVVGTKGVDRHLGVLGMLKRADILKAHNDILRTGVKGISVTDFYKSLLGTSTVAAAGVGMERTGE